MERSFDLAPSSPFAHLELNAHEKLIADMCGILDTPATPNTTVYYTEGRGKSWHVGQVRVAWTLDDRPLVQLEARLTCTGVTTCKPTYGLVKNLFAKANERSGSWVLIPAMRRSNQGPIYLGLAFVYVPFLCAQLDSTANFEYGTEWFLRDEVGNINFCRLNVLNPTVAHCEDVFPLLGSVCFGNYQRTISGNAEEGYQGAISGEAATTRHCNNRLVNLLNAIKDE